MLASQKFIKKSRDKLLKKLNPYNRRNKKVIRITAKRQIKKEPMIKIMEVKVKKASLKIDFISYDTKYNSLPFYLISF